MHHPVRKWKGHLGRLWGVTVAVVALALVVVVAPASAQDDPSVLKVAHTANITTWDPVKSFSTEALYMANMYEPLLWVNPPGSEEPFTPALATDWSVSEDGLTWTFDLREGVTFHDGEPLTADAVVASVEAAKERAGASFIWAPVESVEAVDDLTVAFHLAYPAPVDLIASSLYGAWIVSPKALEAAAADDTYFESGIDAGTGPYTLESWVPDGEVLLTKFDDYWGGWDDVDHYDKVLISIMPESIDQQQALDGGQIDIAFNLPDENLDQYEANPDYTVIREPSLFDYVGFLNTERRRSTIPSCGRRSPTRPRTTTSSRWAPSGSARRREARSPQASSRTPKTPRSTRPTSRRPRRSWRKRASTASTWRSRTLPRTSTRPRSHRSCRTPTGSSAST